ncbi:methyltransferase domain-containing protein [Candidatus Woesearchaeota archaeon]|nr:methyltransferase domain-containing protein [Candidatus Woesearchaeota archaeon]
MESNASRVKKFELLKQKYEEFYSLFYAKGKIPMGDTEKGIWGAAMTDHVFEFFNKINLGKSKTFIDLGSGDGKVVLIASLFGVKATGIEFDKDLIDASIKIRDELELSADFIQGDFLKQDLSRYDVIFINPDKNFEYKLENKLLKEMKSKSKLFVYNNIFLPKILKKGKTYWFEQISIIEYSV